MPIAYILSLSCFHSPFLSLRWPSHGRSLAILSSSPSSSLVPSQYSIPIVLSASSVSEPVSVRTPLNCENWWADYGCHNYTHSFSLYRFEPCTAHFTCSLAKQQQHRHHLCIICHWWDILCSCRHANDFLVSNSSITTASLVCWKTEKPKKKTRISILALMVSNLIMQRWVGW